MSIHDWRFRVQRGGSHVLTSIVRFGVAVNGGDFVDAIFGDRMDKRYVEDVRLEVDAVGC